LNLHYQLHQTVNNKCEIERGRGTGTGEPIDR